jgi:hypothetical protein
VDEGGHQPRRRRRGSDTGKLTWLVEQATGDLADAIARDLFTDGRDFDDLGWRGLWAYITKAPPGTAIHYQRSEGWLLGDKIAAEQLYEQRKLDWRYTAIHFEGGANADFPEPIPYPGAAMTDQAKAAKSWATATIDDLVSPEVRALLRGA